MFRKLFPKKNPLIGVIHLTPMPGYAGSGGFEEVLDGARQELQILQQAGFDGALVENEGDRPHKIAVDQSYRDAFTELMLTLKKDAEIPLGLEILYDMVSTVQVGIAARAAFVRLDVFTDDTETRWGVVKACVSEVQKLRDEATHSPLLFADIHVQRGKNLSGRSLKESGLLALQNGADALIVTGRLTGERPKLQDCSTLREIVGSNPLFVGSGFSIENSAEILAQCNGAIVAASIKSRDRIDLQLAQQLRQKVDALNG